MLSLERGLITKTSVDADCKDGRVAFVAAFPLPKPNLHFDGLFVKVFGIGVLVAVFTVATTGGVGSVVGDGGGIGRDDDVLFDERVGSATEDNDGAP